MQVSWVRDFGTLFKKEFISVQSNSSLTLVSKLCKVLVAILS